MAKRNDITPSSLPCVIEYRIKRAYELLEQARAQLAGIDPVTLSAPELHEGLELQLRLAQEGVINLAEIAPSKKSARQG